MYAYFTNATTSGTLIDEVTKLVMYRILNTNSTMVLILHTF